MDSVHTDSGSRAHGTDSVSPASHHNLPAGENTSNQESPTAPNTTEASVAYPYRIVYINVIKLFQKMLNLFCYKIGHKAIDNK